MDKSVHIPGAPEYIATPITPQAMVAHGLMILNRQHGGCYDRGSADSYYRRPPNPHKYPMGTYNGDPVTELTADEVAAYMKGYMDNEQSGDFKDWG
jgi:hypothetical protein